MENKEKEKVVLSQPDTELTIKIGNSSYDVAYPNAGKFIDIETRKIQYSNNQYDGLLLAGTRESMRAQTMINAAATFGILIPELNKDLTIKSIFMLSMIEQANIIKAYVKQFYPWHKAWLDYLDQLDNDEEAE